MKLALPKNNFGDEPTCDWSRLPVGRDIALGCPHPRNSGWNCLRTVNVRTLLNGAASARGADGAARRPYLGRAQSRVCSAAFTLIEMLIAVAISAMVLAVVSSLFFSALRLRATASEAAEATLPVDRAVAIMKHDLLDIVPVGVLAGPMGSDAVAIGMTVPTILEIFTGSGDINADNPWGDVQKIDYSLQIPTNRNNYIGMNLMRGVTRNLLPSGTVAPDQQTLLEDVQTLKFSYYDGTNWNDTWSTTLSNIPIAIRVSIDFATSRNTTRVKPPVQFLVPIVAWSNTNSITNQLSN